jgi:hypothetical protein
MIKIEKYENKAIIEANKKNAGYENVCSAYHNANYGLANALKFP